MFEGEDPVSKRRVRPGDLNSVDRLFGGQLLAWIDETAAIYATYQLNTSSIVTSKVSEVNFKQPVMQGDFLEFSAKPIGVTRTSLTLKVFVRKVTIPSLIVSPVADCEIVFVCIDENGRPAAHNRQEVIRVR